MPRVHLDRIEVAVGGRIDGALEGEGHAFRTASIPIGEAIAAQARQHFTAR